ncbi:MAG: caspase family protein [Deltaproteobacteria bacterium]|nr:caspase family protein [Deltaproteobacteria bacterium]MBN2674007.1 caspase family protein [Deltaproteobacteria bacterium]
MIRVWIGMFILGVAGMMSSTAMAVTMRYALIVGNNTGVDSDGTTPFMPLKHAEKEAYRLKQKLIGLSNFASDSKRTLLLTGATQKDVRNAVLRLAAQKRKDEQTLGKMESIFLFYFTGHGLEGRLLMKDGALYADEIGKLFEKVNADFAVGVFDACHSGSLSPKGVVSTPGFNMFQEMPREVLNAKGRIWYVSSSAEQVSYEDSNIGGVFTHFFMKGLTDAPKNGPGITLESIWNYARERTVAYTAKQNRLQVPEQYISNFKSSAPVYFSFPKKRTATLQLSKGLHGKFALTYADGQLTEIIEKKPGKPKLVALYAGDITLSYIQGEEVLHVKKFHVEEGGELILRSLSDFAPETPLASSTQTLWAKGTDDLQTLELRKQTAGTSMLLGLTYGYGVASNGVLSSGHMVSVPVRFDTRRWLFGASAGYVADRESYVAWGYRADSLAAVAETALAFDIHSNRLGLGVDFQYMHLWQEFETKRHQQSNSYSPAGRITWLMRKDKRFSAALFVRTGAVYSKAASALHDYYWAFTAGAGMSIFLRVL